MEKANLPQHTKDWDGNSFLLLSKKVMKIALSVFLDGDTPNSQLSIAPTRAVFIYALGR